MTSLMYAVFSIATLQCSVRPEISPCTCESAKANEIELSCEKLESFHTIVDVLSNKFQPYDNINLKITHSQLEDLEMRSFTDMNINVVKLRMQWNKLRSLPELPFRGLSNVKYLSIANNELEEIPKHVLNHMPALTTVDIGLCHIRAVQQDDLRGIPMVMSLILPINNITRLDKGAFPQSLVTLHLGRNQIETLNGSLHELNNLESLFINANSLKDLEGELPDSNMLKLLMAHNNRLERLPSNMRGMNKLEIVHLQFNRLRSFDGVLRAAEYLNELFAYSNELEYLAQDEFQSCRYLENLNLAFNKIRAVNSSLLPMAKLKIANFSFNMIDEFSMDELYGLRSLKILDLSYNRIQSLHPSHKDIHDLPLVDVRLDHNQIITLNAALTGLSQLRILSLPYNKIEYILPGDFDGMERLEILDMTGNQLVELKQLEKTILPSLKIFKVAYNNITKLDKDFYGLPVLCQVDLTNNQISSISSDLVKRTRCKNHNVPGKLEIHLDDNPIMCDVRLNELCRVMMVQDARIRGRSQCFENDQEVCTVLPMLYKIEVPLVQVLMPSPNGLLLKEELLPPIIATLAQPLINKMIITPPVITTTTTTTTPAAAAAATTVHADNDNQSPPTPPPSPSTTTTTAPSTTVAAAQLPATEVVTTIAPTTTTTTTTTVATTPSTTLVTNISTTPRPNETVPVILDIEEHNVTTGGGGHVTARVGEEYPSAPTVVQQEDSEQPPIVAGVEETVAETVAKTEYETVEYVPNMVAQASSLPSKTNLLEEDSQSNSVHEDNAAQNLQIPEEPPEE